MSKRGRLKGKQLNLPWSFWFNHCKDGARVLEPYILVSDKAFPFALNILLNLYTVSHLDDEKYMLGKCKCHFFLCFSAICLQQKYPLSWQSKNQQISNVPVVKQRTVIPQINPGSTSHSKGSTSDGNVLYKIFTGIWDTYFQVRIVFLIHIKL